MNSIGEEKKSSFCRETVSYLIFKIRWNRSGRFVAKAIDGNSVKKGRIGDKIIRLWEIEAWRNLDQQGDKSLPCNPVFVFEVVIPCSEVTKHWSINGNVDERKISPVPLKASKDFIMVQVLV